MFLYSEHDIVENIRALPVGGAAVESYPHVVQKLELFWGYPEFIDYMKSILTTGRERVGFDRDTLAELMFLNNLYLDNMNTINRLKLTDSQIIELNAKLKTDDVWAGNFGR